jgi:hypothetical protein
MKRNGALALIGIVVGAVALIVVGLIAYGVGANVGNNGGHVLFGPMMRGYRGGGFWMDNGLGFGFIVTLIFVFVVIWLFVRLITDSGRRSASSPNPPYAAPGARIAPAPPADAANLRELVEMHDRGALTDEEFAAAKRKLLGL